MGFCKGKTWETTFQLKIITERRIYVSEVYLCFGDYQKDFNRVNHGKLTEVMNAEIEQQLIISLYLNQ